MKLFKTIVFLVSFFSLALVVFPTAAQISTIDGGKYGVAQGENAQDLIDTVGNVINVFLGLVGIAAVIAIITGGVYYITSAGDTDRQSKAKSTIMYAILGLVIVGLSAAIANFTINAIKKSDQPQLPGFGVPSGPSQPGPSN